MAFDVGAARAEVLRQLYPEQAQRTTLWAACAEIESLRAELELRDNCDGICSRAACESVRAENSRYREVLRDLGKQFAFGLENASYRMCSGLCHDDVFTWHRVAQEALAGNEVKDE